MISNLTIALLLLPIVGAAIAWAGDVIGSALGRGRRSVFGLRPRSTARLVAVIVGAVLPLAGLLFAMVVSDDAKVALLHLRELRQQAARLDAENTRLQASVQEARRQAGAAKSKVDQAESKLAGTEQVLRASKSILTTTQATLETNRKKLTSVQSDLQTTRGNLSEARSGLSEARSSLSEARSSLSEARSSLQQARAELTTAKSELDGARKDLERRQADLKDAEGRLADANSELESVTAELKQLRTLERKVILAQEYLAEAYDRLAAKQQELEETERRLAVTEQALDYYKIAYSAIIEQDIALEPGQELIRSIVDSSLTQDQLEAVLKDRLNLASRAATGAHGIAIGPSGRSVRVVSPIPPHTSPESVSEIDIVREVATQIRRGGAPNYVVIIRAWSRAYKGQAQPMAVEFWVAPNKVLFHAGEVIFSTLIDGSLPRARVFGALWESVAAIRRVAADRGMLPNPDTGHYGGVPAEMLLDAMDEILATGGPARAQFVVTKDARVAQLKDDPLALRVEVTEADRER